MPIYEFKCPQCGERSEEFAKMSESNAEFVCRACSVKKQRVFSLPNRERQFHGTESVSLTEGFAKNEVLKARRMLPQFQHCIRDDGSVVFANRSEQRKYVAAQEKAFSSLTKGT
jgi:putative FmdB family regulatory protein